MKRLLQLVVVMMMVFASFEVQARSITFEESISPPPRPSGNWEQGSDVTFSTQGFEFDMGPESVAVVFAGEVAPVVWTGWRRK